MALIHCPECGGTVSDQAPACVHCGCPLEAPKDDARYALVLLDRGPDPEATAQVLSQWAAITRKEALDRMESVPMVLLRNLDRDRAKDAAAAFGKCSGIKVVLDDNANSLSQAVTAPAVTFRTSFQPVSKMSFGALVGAIVAGNVITMVVFWLLGAIF